ncbi:MAG: hypothetical protein V7K67_27340 [Nostoc sp.]|uniref:hypothetical protein n=1 Tax=Nostoc sp. TaxID=1180 RepID=UPI002FFAB5EE
MNLALAQQSLAGLSQTAAHLWEQLTNCQTPEEEAAIITAIWETQGVQEEVVDIQAELALQLDAEIAAIKQRLEHLKAVHQSALLRLERWRQKLAGLTQLAQGDRTSVVLMYYIKGDIFH